MTFRSPTRRPRRRPGIGVDEAKANSHLSPVIAPPFAFEKIVREAFKTRADSTFLSGSRRNGEQCFLRFTKGKVAPLLVRVCAIIDDVPGEIVLPRCDEVIQQFALNIDEHRQVTAADRNLTAYVTKMCSILLSFGIEDFYKVRGEVVRNQLETLGIPEEKLVSAIINAWGMAADRATFVNRQSVLVAMEAAVQSGYLIKTSVNEWPAPGPIIYVKVLPLGKRRSLEPVTSRDQTLPERQENPWARKTSEKPKSADSLPDVEETDILMPELQQSRDQKVSGKVWVTVVSGSDGRTTAPSENRISGSNDEPSEKVDCPGCPQGIGDAPHFEMVRLAKSFPLGAVIQRSDLSKVNFDDSVKSKWLKEMAVQGFLKSNKKGGRGSAFTVIRLF